MTTSASLRRFLRFAMSGRRYTNEHSTFTRDASRWVVANIWMILPALVCCCPTALGQQSLAAQKPENVSLFFGRWTTEAPGLDGITRLEIGSNASTISIHVWAACQQGECDWGSRSIGISAADTGVMSLIFTIRDRRAALTITPLPDRRLRVAGHTTYSDSRPQQDYTQEFIWLCPAFPTFSATSPVGADTWSAISQSVVVFFTKQPEGQLAPAGYGLLVKKNLVATNNDVAKNTTNLQARIAARSELSPVLDVLKVDEGGAIALVRVLGLRGWPLGLDVSSQLAEKETVFVITNLKDPTISSSSVSKLRMVHGFPQIEIAASFPPAESGSPVFNRIGTVVGITASNPEGASKPGLVIAAKRLTALMPELASLPPGSVDSKPKPLNSPQPRYTNEARDHQVEGTVTMRVLIGADGLVKQVKVVKGLPDGLDEEAIKAAYKLKFKPAMKDGQPVAYWMPVVVEFNLGAPRSRPFAASE